jgi:DNA repair exonuclease SbcCD ATPase subunit
MKIFYGMAVNLFLTSLLAIERETYFMAALEEKDHPEIAAYLLRSFPQEEQKNKIKVYNVFFQDKPYQPLPEISEQTKKELEMLKQENENLKAQTQQAALVQTKNTQLEAQIKQLQTEKEAFQKKIEELNVLSAKATSLEKEKAQLEQEKNGLQAQIVALNKEAQEKQAKLAALEQEKNAAKTEQAALTAKNSTLEKEKEVSKQAKIDLEKKISELTQMIANKSNFQKQLAAKPQGQELWKLVQSFFTEQGQEGTEFINILAKSADPEAKRVAQSIIDQLQNKVMKVSPVKSQIAGDVD